MSHSSDFSEMSYSKSGQSSPVNIYDSSSDESQIQKAVGTSKETWPKYKHFRDPETGEEAIYVLLQPAPEKQVMQAKSDEAWRICRQLLDLSSISLFVASNLLSFTVGLLIGKRSAEF